MPSPAPTHVGVGGPPHLLLQDGDLLGQGVRPRGDDAGVQQGDPAGHLGDGVDDWRLSVRTLLTSPAIHGSSSTASSSSCCPRRRQSRPAGRPDTAPRGPGEERSGLARGRGTLPPRSQITPTTTFVPRGPRCRSGAAHQDSERLPSGRPTPPRPAHRRAGCSDQPPPGLRSRRGRTSAQSCRSRLGSSTARSASTFSMLSRIVASSYRRPRRWRRGTPGPTPLAHTDQEHPHARVQALALRAARISCSGRCRADLVFIERQDDHVDALHCRGRRQACAPRPCAGLRSEGSPTSAPYSDVGLASQRTACSPGRSGSSPARLKVQASLGCDLPAAVCVARFR